jgi:Gcd10p family
MHFLFFFAGVESTEANNREIFDSKDAQKLTHEDIERMKREFPDEADEEVSDSGGSIEQRD